MNPMLILQAGSAAAGLIGSLIPDKEKTVMNTTYSEGSELAGKVPGAAGATTQKTFSKETYQPGIKKGLLAASGVMGAAGSIGGALAPNMNVSGSGLLKNISGLFNSVSKTSAEVKAPLLPVVPGLSDTDLAGLQDTFTPALISKIRLR